MSPSLLLSLNSSIFPLPHQNISAFSSSFVSSCKTPCFELYIKVRETILDYLTVIKVLESYTLVIHLACVLYICEGQNI